MKRQLYRKVLTNLLLTVSLLTVLATCEKPERIISFITLEALEADISYTSATLRGEIIDAGSQPVDDYGLVYSTDPNPRIGNATIKSAGTEIKKGVFSITISGLTRNTKYYFRAYVTIDDNDIHADKIYSFTTKDYQAPLVTAGTVTEITMTSTSLNGEVTSDGGEASTTRGLCWGSSANPTITSCIDTTVNGTGTGTFTGRITGLTAGTIYYVRAYATNSKGTAYNSADVIFKTHSLPLATTAEVTNITGTGATAGGEVTYDGGTEVTARGVCWSTTSNPTVTLTTKTTDGTGEGVFESTIAGLTSGTTYYIRAYATNQYGTSYGEEKTFIATKAPQVTTVAATLIGKSSATLNGTVNANNASSAVIFEYGLTTSYGSSVTATPGTVTGNTATAVEGNLSALDAGTTYHFRVKAVNSGGTAYGDDLTFTTLQDPGATTLPATGLTTTSATLNGSVNANNSETAVSFQYGISSSYGSSIAASPTPVNGNTATSISAALSSLTPGTTYHYRVRAISEAGEKFGADQEFTTLEIPDATTLAATTVTGTTATLNGSITANNSETTVIFEYGQTTSYGLTVSATPAQVTGDTPAAVSAGLTSLTPATEYHFRVKAESAAGIKYGEDKIFTTSQAPSATTNPATNIATVTATLNGTVNAAGSSTTVTFDYGETTSYGMSVTALQSPVSGAGNTAVSADISGLTEGTLYHFRVKAVNGGGTTYGSDVTFTTITKPTVTTSSITDITINSASGGGNVTSDGGSAVTMRGVCWSTAENPTLADTKTENGAASGTFTSSLTTLVSGTNYHVRAYATNAAGTAYGNDVSFTTLKLPDATTGSASSIGSASATLNGTVNANGSSTTVTFEYGETTSYGTEVTADQSPVEGNTVTAVSKSISGLTPSTTYHYRVKAVSAAGTDYGDDMTFATPADPLTVSDFDGNVYNIITIGTQEWMQKNLLVTHYNNGDAIPVVTDNAAWSGLTNGAYCWYNDDETTYKNTYGALYNYYTTNDVRNVCPDGWHIPTDAEWTSLTDLLGGEFVAGGKLKEIGITHWQSPNTDATNETGFSALPGGNRDSYGTYFSNGNNGFWWSTTEIDFDGAYYRIMQYNSKSVGRWDFSKKGGFSIRCLKGELPLAESNSATGVTTTNATLNGKANPNGITTAISFEYGTTTSYGSTITADQSPSSLSVPVVATASLTTLTPGTEYHYRIKAENSAGTTYGSDITFSTTALTPPTATTGSATGVGATTAVLNGMVNANGLSTTVTFEYGETTSYGTEVAASESPVNGSSATPVSVGLSSLSTDVTYHYRVKAVSSGGTVYGEDMTFTTKETVTDADGNVYNVITIGTQKWIQPDLQTTKYSNGESITLVEGNSAWAALTSGGYCWYDNNISNKTVYGALYNWWAGTDIRNVCPTGWHNATYDDYVTLSAVGAGALKETGTAHWTEPDPSSTNSSGFTAVPGGVRSHVGSFTALGAAWQSWTSDVFDPGRGWYTGISGLLGQGLSCLYFQYGLSIRCVRGEIPLVETNSATAVASTTVTMNGKVNPNGASTTVTFEYGTTTSYGATATAAQSPVPGAIPVDISAGLTTLIPGTEYHYRVKAVNSGGTSYGSDLTFNTTFPPPIATTGSATAVASASATLNGIINANGYSTAVTFEYGLTTSYGTEVTSDQSPVTGFSNTTVSKSLPGLVPSTTYHYRVKGISSEGTGLGTDMTFTTPAQVTDIEGNLYNTFLIGSQIWMQENLTTEKFNDNTDIPNVTDNETWKWLTTPGYCYFLNNPAAYKGTYGALYNWFTVNTGKLCPTGWHVPSPAEWQTLQDYLGGSSVAGGKMKTPGTVEATTGLWYSPNLGATNESGFSALPASSRDKGLSFDVAPGEYTDIWTSDEAFSGFAKAIGLHKNTAEVINYFDDKADGFSVRCIKGALPYGKTNTTTAVASTTATLNGNIYANGASTTVFFEYGTTASYGSEVTATQSPVLGTTPVDVSAGLTGLTPGTEYHYRVKAVNSGGTGYGSDATFTTPTQVSDVDGNVYNTVIIGTQTWMQENLKTTKYKDGTTLPEVTENTTWNSLSSGAYCWFNNDASTYKNLFGALYNWYTVADVKGICPVGWHVPSDSEWTILAGYLGGSTLAGGKLKESGTTHWPSPNSGATNETQFTALPAGDRNYVGGFSTILDYTWLWSSTYNWCQRMTYDDGVLLRGTNEPRSGFSVRCLKD